MDERLHPATALLDELARTLPLVACMVVDASGAVRARSRGAAESIEGGIVSAGIEALTEAALGVLRATGEATVDGILVEGSTTHAYVRPFGEGAVVAAFDPAQATFGAVRMALRRQSEPLALLVQVEPAGEPVERLALRRFLALL